MFMYKQNIIAVETVPGPHLFKHCIFLKRKTCPAIYMGCIVFLMRSDQWPLHLLIYYIVTINKPPPPHNPPKSLKASFTLSMNSGRMCICEKDSDIHHRTELPRVKSDDKQHRYLPQNKRVKYGTLNRTMCTVLMWRQGELRKAVVCRKAHALLALYMLPDCADFNMGLCRHVP